MAKAKSNRGRGRPKAEKPVLDDAPEEVVEDEIENLEAVFKHADEAKESDVVPDETEVDAPDTTESEDVVEAASEVVEAASETAEDAAETASEDAVEAAEAEPEQDAESTDNDAADSVDDTDETSAPVDDAADAVEAQESDAEDTSENAAPEPAPLPPPVAEPEKRSVWPMVLAGVVVAGLGYVAGRGDVISNFLPPNWRPVDNLAEVQAELQEKLDAATAETGAVKAQAETLQAEIEGLKTQLAELPAPTDLAPVEAALADAGSRIEALEARPIATVDGEAPPPPDYSGAFKELKEQSEAQQAEIQALLDEQAAAEAAAQETAQKALAQTALGRIQAALDAGEPFADALTELQAAGVTDVPDALSAVAADGVTTLGELQVGISDAARDALAAARASAGTASGVAGFFERQLGVRSLEPQEGDDPDAVLSRIVAKTEDGDLETALVEAEQLPEAARDAMSDWLENATARASAATAAASLSDSLATN